VTSQDEFGGAWTQQKLEALGKYLRAYTIIFKRNPRAQYYSISYVDAFAGTGSLQRPELAGFAEFMPELRANEEQYRKGSVLRALEIDPPFDNYLFIEKNAAKCQELREAVRSVRPRNVTVLNDDANAAILKWCTKLDTKRQRAVVFLDPFGASVRFEVITALAKTKAVDLTECLSGTASPTLHGQNV
jgi:three-Cys-motif partner protein